MRPAKSFCVAHGTLKSVFVKKKITQSNVQYLYFEYIIIDWKNMY